MIKSIQVEIPFRELNMNIEAHLVEEGKEEEKLRNLMK